MSSLLAGGSRQAPTQGAAVGRSSAPPGAAAPGAPPAPASGAPRSNAVTVIAGVGVLLLAMGVGVLIGRAGAARSRRRRTAAGDQRRHCADRRAAGAQPTRRSRAFTSDWPAATSGYTVQLQTLPQPGTQTSAVEAAKTEATARKARSPSAR